MRTIYSDGLCIGAGLAGERVALAAAMEGFHTICLSVVPPRRSHSSAAQGGMQAALGNAVMGKGDSTDIHFADTVKGSDWGCDQEVARIFADSAPIVMREMAHWGVPWNRVVAGKHTYYKGGKPFEAEEEESKHGLIHARAFGGTAKWRTCYTADGTGRSVLNTLDSKCLQYGVEIHDRMQAEALIHDGERCMGAIVRSLRDGELVAKTIDDIISCRNGKENCFDLRNAMQDVMMDDVGIFRNAKDLQNGVDRLLELSERAKHIGLHGSVKGFTPELSMALRVPGMIKLALCTAYGALQRTESRGAHTREDFPARNDAEWLTRTLAYWKEGDSLPTLKYEDASPWFELPPGERGYGGGKIIPAEIPADKIKTKEQAEEAIK